MNSRDEKSGDQSVKDLNKEMNSESQNYCPICKTITSDKALTDTCGHEFCLDCLKQWSVEHNSCPVCRQVYHKIITNIRPNGVFDEIPLRQQTFQFVLRSMNRIIRELEDLFILRLQQLKESISTVEQSLQQLKAMVREIEAEWEQNRNQTNGQTLAVNSDQNVVTNTEPIVAEAVGIDSLGQISRPNEDNWSPNPKKRRTETDSNEDIA